MTDQCTFDESVDVVAIVPDVMFASRIFSIANQLGHSIAIARTMTELDAILKSKSPRVALIDLSARGIDVAAAIDAAKAAGTSEVIAFGPHKDLAARAAALEAGADRWVTNQRLAAELTELLRGRP